MTPKGIPAAVKTRLAGNSKLHNSALVSAVGLGLIELAAHLRHLTIPMLDQAFIAAVGVLFAPQGDKEDKADEKA